MSLNYISRVPCGLETAQSDCREQRLLSFERSDSYVNGRSGCTRRKFERQLRARFFSWCGGFVWSSAGLGFVLGIGSRNERGAALAGPEWSGEQRGGLVFR